MSKAKPVQVHSGFVRQFKVERTDVKTDAQIYSVKRAWKLYRQGKVEGVFANQKLVQAHIREKFINEVLSNQAEYEKDSYDRR